jgi:hypothetical protein
MVLRLLLLVHVNVRLLRRAAVLVPAVSVVLRLVRTALAAVELSLREVLVRGHG